MHKAIADRHGDLAALCERYDVARLEVFGSAARGADFDATRSDADFLVEFKPSSTLPALEQFFGLAEALEKVLGRKVDLVEAGAVENPYLRASIDLTKETIFGA